MEHRWSKRVPVRLSVAMVYGPLGLVMGKTRDISAEGMFVETHHVSLFDDEMIEISFTYGGRIPRTIVRTYAYVVHASEAGVGLKLRDFCFDFQGDPPPDFPLLVNSR